MVPGADSYVQPEVERLEYASCLSAVSVPSGAAPRVTVCATADRCPVTVNVCSRVSTVLTGRPSARAAAAVTRSCVHVLDLVAEAATDVLADHPHLGRVQPEHAGDALRVADRRLAAGVRGELVVLPHRQHRVRFHRAGGAWAAAGTCRRR